MRSVNLSYHLISYCLFVCLSFISCTEKNDYVTDPDYLHRSIKKLSDIIVHDILSPPVASRAYVYPLIAAYEASRHSDPDIYLSYAHRLNELSTIPSPEPDKEYNFDLAAINAFFIISKTVVFSELEIEEFQIQLQQEMKNQGIPKRVFTRSLSYGELVANHILTWISKDNYKEIRSYPKYSINQEERRWKPTPPAYMDGIEPHWNQMRTMLLDSANQFTPPPPTPFDLNKNSPFFQETMEVYDVVKNTDEEKTEIANFWDCNPYALSITGHVMTSTKKITPGGHWIGITGVACQKDNSSFSKSCLAYSQAAIMMYDAFISCWDEKYRSNLVRPETVINDEIDPSWQPLLQTPPFPEYTSGHSVISRAAAIALTDIYGPDFYFEDDVEVEYGLPIRRFRSFIHASDEAAISRLYGGIHYRPAIEYGVIQGEQVAKYGLSKLKKLL